MGTAVGAGVGSGVGLGPGSNPEVPLPMVPVGLGVGMGGRGVELGVAPCAALPAVPGWLEAWAVRAGPLRPELAAVPRLWPVAVGLPPPGVGTDNLGSGKLVGTRPLTHSVTPRPTSG